MTIRFVAGPANMHSAWAGEMFVVVPESRVLEYIQALTGLGFEVRMVS